jgi:hypothetical protein
MKLNINNLVLPLTLCFNSYMLFELRNTNQALLVRLSDCETNLNLVSKELTSLKHQIVVEKLQDNIILLEKIPISSSTDFYSFIPNFNTGCILMSAAFVLSSLTYLIYPCITAKFSLMFYNSIVGSLFTVSGTPLINSEAAAATTIISPGVQVSDTSSLQLVVWQPPISTASDLNVLAVSPSPPSPLNITVSENVDSCGRICEYKPHVVSFVADFVSKI